MKTVLQENPPPDQKEWKFTVAPESLQLRRSVKAPGTIYGKRIAFTAAAITLEIDGLSNNRILQDDDPSKFIAVSFGGLRFPDSFLRVTGEYIQSLMAAGLYLNGTQYRFYHHSNSQLKERSCFMRAADSDAELDKRIYQLGEFEKINNVAKRAKRIGLLFSGASLDFMLDPQKTLDIPDMTVGEEVFSDGCGLMARALAIQVARRKAIKFRNKRYTPTVFQIRYLGYKGVLMIHPELDKEKKYLVHFRKSMKKFNSKTKNTFSVVDYSTPYTFGRLNNDIIVLLSSLEVTNEKLLAKQQEYFDWIEEAATNHLRAVDFLSCIGKYEEAERVLLDGLENPRVFERVRDAQKSEVSKFRKDDGKPRTRMMIRKSRLLFGVCDPYGVLKEGQVHVRFTTENGASTLMNADVLVVRNPCLHPGDCLKLRAAAHPKLAHLVDCVVFAAVARPGHPSAPSMSSGGDLDGDRYFVCWDPDIVPPTMVQSYNYPPNKERVQKSITRQDLAAHFAMYNNSSLARVAALHQKWIKCKPEGALSVECQELNALHSQSVDGGKIRIPDRLSNPPETEEPFILDLLAEAATAFSERFLESLPVYDVARDLPHDDAMEYIRRLLRGERHAFSEFEMFNMAVAIARKREIDLRPMLPYLNLGALTVEQKYTVSSTLGLTPEEDRYTWNSLFQSDILTDRDLEQRGLKKTIPLQRFYSSNKSGLRTFWQYLKICLEDFTRKVLILKIDNRFGIGIFIRGQVPWEEDTPANDKLRIVVCSFMPTASGPMSTYRTCSTDYRLHVGDNILQLFEKLRSNSFVFMARPPAASGSDVITSIALQKISAPVQRQCGRVYRSPVTTIELHVVSNRDRVAHQLFDLYFEHVETEAYIRRLAQQKLPFTINRLEEVDWSEGDRMWMKELFIPKSSREKIQAVLQTKEIADVEKVLALCLDNHAYDELFWAFYTIIAPIQRMNVDVTKYWIERHPPLVYCLLKTQPPTEDRFVSPFLHGLELTIVQNIVKSANQMGIAALVALEKIAESVARISMDDYLHLLLLASLSVRSSELVQEILLVLYECRTSVISRSPMMEYAHKHALGITFDRAEEAADECPCNDQGRPKKARGKGPAPATVRLIPEPDEPTQVIAHVRVDEPTAVRIHSHVRLQAASDPEKGWVGGKQVVDAVVVLAKKGEMKMELQYPLPPEYERMQWKMYNAGSVATAKAMLDAVGRLVNDGRVCCAFSNLIVGKHQNKTGGQADEDDADRDIDGDLDEDGLNPNQVRAVESCDSPLALIWGPPGTGKTTVVVKILRKLFKTLDEEEKILMTASTHNAVDNVLERFIKLNAEEDIVPNDQILRVATDSLKVSKALQDYTIDARVGGDMNENNRLAKKAQERVKSAKIVFTTCAGAGLGTLRKVNFEIAIIDEASQITEACALVPLVKGCKKAVLVGDHVQLRPMVRKMAGALLHDVSMLERLYTGPNAKGMSKTMLNVQYRFPKQLAVFPSNEFYKGRLKTGITDAAARLAVLKGSKFPWPLEHGVVVPIVFVQCGSEEDMGGRSKSNVGQAEVVQKVIKLLITTKDAPEEDNEPKGDPKKKGKAVDRGPEPQVGSGDGASSSKKDEKKPEITVLSPYAKQVSELKSRVPPGVGVHTIDSFQGRESEIVIFSTVRCNVEREIGFVEDERRLNVMWTRAKLALVIVGDRATLAEKSGLWKRALGSCEDVVLPEDPEGATAPPW